MRHQLSQYDDLGSRKEIWKLLDHPRMTDRRRANFMQWCCSLVDSNVLRWSIGPGPDGKYGALHAWGDLQGLGWHGLDWSRAVAELTRRIRRL